VTFVTRPVPSKLPRSATKYLHIRIGYWCIKPASLTFTDRGCFSSKTVLKNNKTEKVSVNLISKSNHLQPGNPLWPCNFASSSKRGRRYLPEIVLQLGLYWTLRKQSWQGCFSSFELGGSEHLLNVKKKNTHTHTQHVTKCHTVPRTWTDILKRPRHHKTGSPCGLVVANSYEEDNEPSVP